jgi:hypothetical protein
VAKVPEVMDCEKRAIIFNIKIENAGCINHIQGVEVFQD